MKYTILTFDYEVFLGNNTGSIEKSVINPTSVILNILKQQKAKAFFFIDATWLLFLKRSFPRDFQLVSGQIKRIVDLGSSVELHLHPQWIDAIKKDGKIVFNSLKHYKLQALNEKEIVELFRSSIDLLQNITHKKIKCFRAGGWCIEPFEKIRKAFLKFGITYDFSVLPGISLKEGLEYDFDFSKAPNLPFYKFHDEASIQDDNGYFIEFPLSTFRSNPGYRFINKFILKLNKDQIFGDGTGSKEKSVYKTIYDALLFTKSRLTLDRTSNTLFKYLLLTHFRKSHLLVIVSHPKIISPQALMNLIWIIKKTKTLNSDDLYKFIVKEMPD